jgi:hypothetical protein
MRDQRLYGKRYIALVRCSTKGQADTSIDDQLRLIRRFAAENGMVEVDVVRLEGVSGSIAENLDRVIASLIERKIAKNDFDCIMVQDASRFSRTGPWHSAKMRYDLDRTGVEVISALGYMPKSDFGDVKDALDAVVAKQQAKSIAAGVARGSQSALESGRKAHCSLTPYGLDKLYVAEDGRPLHVIRTNYADGTQLRLHPTTGEVLDRYGRNLDSGAPAHYRKQKHERVRLIPGEPAAVEVVRSIYRRYFSDQVGYWTIAMDLNDRGTPSPAGKGWSLSTVKAIIDNPVYSGRGIANRTTMALYYCRAADVPSEAPKARRTASGRPAQTMRPASEWVVAEYPELAEFLPPDLLPLAAEHHQRILDDLRSGRERTARDKHHGSDFLLKGILKTVDGQPMSGQRKGRHGEHRYYAVSKAFSHPTSDKVARRMVPAEPLEATALYLAKSLILSMPGLRDEIAAECKAAVRRRAGDGQDREALAAEVRRLDRRIAVALDEFDGEDESAVRAKLAELKTKRRETSERLAAMATPAALSDPDVEKFVDAVIAVHVEQAEALRELPAAHLRELLKTFIESMTVDLATMRVEMVARIPLWASGSAAKASEAMGLDCTSVYKAVAEAHPLAGAERRLWFVVPPQGLRQRAA